MSGILRLSCDQNPLCATLIIKMIKSAKRRLHLLSGRVHPELAEEVAANLGIQLCNVTLTNFANGEIFCRINESVRGADIFIMQTHAGDLNHAIMEQAIMIDAAKRASAASITAVCPFLGYTRQDRKSGGREPISGRLVVDLLSSAGADRIVSVDLHSGQTQGFFNGPFDHLIAMPSLVKHIAPQLSGKDVVVVSPDAGRVKSAERYSSALGSSVAIIHKHRPTNKANVAEARYLIGDVEGKTCLVIDDMVDTAGTLCTAADMLAQHGAKEVYGLTTHGLFSDPAIERIEQSAFKKIISTNTVPEKKSSKIEYVSIAPLLAAAVNNIFEDASISALFDGKNQM